MDNKEAFYRQKIESYFPQMHVKSIKPTFDHGLHNDLMLVNDEVLVRFAKVDYAKDLLENELKCINLIREKTNIPVPQMERLEYGVVYYPYINGEPLFRHKLFEYDKIKQKELMEQIGHYMNQLHSIPLDDIKSVGIEVSPASTEDPVEAYERLVSYYKRVKDELYPHMRAYTRSCVEASFRGIEKGAEWFNYTPCLIHGDLALEHIIVDENYNNVVGILDFGVAGIGNPASDIGVLLFGLGEEFTLLMSQAYQNLDYELSRAKVGLCSAGWHLRGLDTGDVFWHLVHLMTAKDIRY